MPPPAFTLFLHIWTDGSSAMRNLFFDKIRHFRDAPVEIRTSLYVAYAAVLSVDVDRLTKPLKVNANCLRMDYNEPHRLRVHRLRGIQQFPQYICPAEPFFSA